MSQLPREELAQILFQEVEGYLPKIGNGLTALQHDGKDQTALHEVHRFFHNIKGAASQVDFSTLSEVASRCENVLAATLDTAGLLGSEELNFLWGVHDRIEEFCTAADKSQDAEHSHFDDALNSAYGRDNFSGTSFLEDDSFDSDWDTAFADDESAVAPLADDVEAESVRLECLTALRSILPLLQELTECSAQTTTSALPASVLTPMSRAVATLSECTLTAGLYGQHQLLNNFHILLEQMSRTPELLSGDTPALLQEIVTYLDLLFSLNPGDAEQVITRVQGRFNALADIILTGGVDLQQEFLDEESSELFITAEEEDTLFLEEEFPFEDDVPVVSEIAEEEPLFEFPDDDETLQNDFLTDDEPAEAGEETTLGEEDELFAIFQAECEEHLQVINRTLNTLETAVSGNTPFTQELRETVAHMRRAVHTLKGAAGMTGFDYLSSCAHSLEDLLDWLHDDSTSITGDDVAIIAEAIDTIELLSIDREKEEQSLAEIYSEKIEAYLHSRTGAATPAAAAGSIEVDEVQAEEEFGNFEETTTEEIAAHHPEADAALPGTSGNVRVQLTDLDELAGIEGELVVARGSIEKLLEKLSGSLGELTSTKEALARKTQELEVGFEAQSLYGFGPAPSPGMQSIMEEPSSALSDFDPIELDRYSQLNLIIRSLNEISIDVNAIHTEISGLANEIRGQVSKQQLAMGVMQEKLMRIRMTPMSSISRVLYRTVRQTASNLGKDVRLTLTGEDVYMDRFIWTKTLDPLMHILRNCIDHGIEDGESRKLAGKPETGKISIVAKQRNRYVVIRISDDGRGIDIDRLRRKLLAEGFIDNSRSYSNEELLRFLFRASFSTKEDISQISGRGVGLDVVLKNIQELRGSVRIENSPGKGVTFELNIPITLSINRAIIVEVSGRHFAVPIQEIVEVHKFSGHELETLEENKVLYNDKLIDAVDLAPRLQLPPRSGDESSRAGRLMLVIDNDGEHQALMIDSVVEQREIVIKNLGSHLRYVRGINGVTMTGEGSVIPILNLQELASESQISVKTIETDAQHVEVDTPMQVLIVDDSISVRYSIARLVEGQSWIAHQAVDGVDALQKLEDITPDIIVLDIEMPRMNGYEFLAAMKAREQYAAIPVVMLTSRASEKHRKKAEELGASKYVTKPYDERDFVELLRETGSHHLNTR